MKRLDVVTPEEYARRVAERNAEEELDGKMPEHDEDFADLTGE